MSKKESRVIVGILMILSGVLSAISLPFTFFWPNLLPFEFFHFWKIQGSLIDAILGAWPIYVWGIGITAYQVLWCHNGYSVAPASIFKIGTLISLRTGVVEEILFRWIFFFAAIVAIPFLDWLLLGFAGYNWIQWLCTVILVPFTDLLTFGYLKPYLYSEFGWFVGAAIVCSNGQFSQTHVPKGWFSVLNSWCLGLYLFWLMFTYGLPAAIIIHFLYDLFIFAIVAIDAKLEQRELLQ